MSRISPENQTSASVADELSHARLERLLRGARDAALLGHRLALLNIEAKHRLSQYHSHYNPNQPRVPAGHPDGGQWTSAGGTTGSGTSQVLSDVTPGNDWKPGAQYANNSRRGRGSGPEPEPGQAARRVVAIARARDAVRRVRELDPNWRPRREALYGEGVESDIRKAEDLAEEAEARLLELAGGSPPTIPKQRPPTTQERNDAAREIAKWLARNLGRVIEGIAWLDEFEESIQAYLDPPKTLKELRKGLRRERRDMMFITSSNRHRPSRTNSPDQRSTVLKISYEYLDTSIGRLTPGTEDQTRTLVGNHLVSICGATIGMSG